MKPLIIFFFAALAFAASGHAQGEKQDPLAAAIEAKEYVFRVRSMMPQSGSTQQVTSSYDFTVRHDSIISYLPYFGRAYVAPIGRSTDPLNFTSIDFSYTVSPAKKGGWLIEIKPKDAPDVRVMNLSISSKGYATLFVNAQNRQSISYSGKVEALKK